MGSEEAGRLPVIADLQADDKVLLKPGESARDGAKVRVAAGN